MLEGFDEGLGGLVENLKRMRINLRDNGPRTLVLKGRGPDSLIVGAFRNDVRVEFINPKHFLATLKPNAAFHARIRVRRKSYYQSRYNAEGAFQSVRRVKYRVESRATNRYEEGDRVILQVSTHGDLSPDAAMEQAMMLLRQQYAVYGHPVRHLVFAHEVPDSSRVQSELARKLAMSVNEFELSVRAANCLNNANIQTIGELAGKTESELLRFRNFGRKSLVEIRGLLSGFGLSLGMDANAVPAMETTPDWPNPPLDSRLAQSVGELELSVRATNCLKSANIQTIGELVAKTDAELLKYRNFGRGSLNNIKQALAEIGLSLGMPDAGMSSMEQI
jgi:DNA-directed RNA polymerase subunit alpha